MHLFCGVSGVFVFRITVLSLVFYDNCILPVGALFIANLLSDEIGQSMKKQFVELLLMWF